MRYRLADDVAIETLDGGAVVLHLTQGRYYELNKVATRAVEALAGEGELPMIVDRLSAEFDVTTEQLESDLIRLFDELVANGLVVTT